MKKFVKFLAKVTGVEKDIRKEVTEEIGNRIYNDSFWFTGSYYGDSYKELRIIYNVLQKIGVRLIKKHRYSIDRIRDEIVEDINDEKDSD